MPLSPSDREHARADAALLVRSTPLARSRYLAEIMAEQGAAYLAEVEALLDCPDHRGKCEAGHYGHCRYCGRSMRKGGE